ncbi:hypothetical protein [Kineosporia babensis]|uniref:Uncharacterized protein n=1 Tax=Kineosporia babensis TaxID=499548 RepID=A0A9X1N9F5_9ACTN|nr:hypothetical protein [Kineosporia babensis]MCD5310822.1 hypothetical protein [Kineosporia babensis]
MPYAPYYPAGWRDLPNTSTPIVAAALDHMDAGIAAAQTAAETALATGGKGGGGYVVVPGLALNGLLATPTDDGLAIQAALEKVEDGETPGHLFVTGPAGSSGYLNSTITIAKSGCILEFDPAVQWYGGPDLRIRPWGVIPETPVANPDKPALTEDAPMGATVLKVTTIPADWTVGIYVGLRGKRTASGSVPNAEIFHSYVTGLNRGVTPMQITLADPLPKTFLAVNDTTWSNKLSQVTMVKQMRLTGTPDAGETIISVEDSSIFPVNTTIQIQDNVHTIDGDGTIRTGNFAHKEVNVVAEVVDGTRIKLAAPLQHSYVVAEDGRVTVLSALHDAQVRGLRLKWRAQQADGQHAIEVRYAVNTHIVDTRIEGGGNGGVSWSGHGIRFTDSLHCSAQRGFISNPSLLVAGRGYGISFYGSTGCWVQDFAVSGCRHSYLWFNGSSACGVVNSQSEDCRISDYDWHGAEENGNWTHSCVARGGTRSTDDSDGRTAWKFGNPSQCNGARGNTATDSLVLNYHGTAIEVLPQCRDNSWQGVVRGARVGLKLTQTPDNDEYEINGFTLRDSEFYDVRAPFHIDGGATKTISGLLVENVTFTRCGPLQIANIPGARLFRLTVEEPTGTGWQVMAWGSDAIRINNSDLSWTPKGIALTSCPQARVVHNVLHDLTGPELHDGGGNTGLLFRSNEIFPDAGSFTRTGTASTGTTLQAGLTDAGTESIGAATTGTAWVDPEDALGDPGDVPPGGGGAPVDPENPEEPGGGTPPGAGVMPLVGRSGKAWNSGTARWEGHGTGTPAKADAFGSWRGKPVDGFMNFHPRQTWSDLFVIPSDWPAWVSAGRYIVNSLPPQPETEGGGSNAATAAGSNNARWVNYGSALAAAGLNSPLYVLRLGWECNGYWFKWSYGDEGGMQTPKNSVASFQQAVINVSQSIKSTAPNVLIDVTLNRGSNRSGITLQQVMEPLVPHIDIVGLDHYDWYPGQTNSGSWNSARNQQPGFNDLRPWLQDKGLQLGVPEWGLVNAAGGSAGGAGGDNAYYITQMHNEFAALAGLGLLAYEGYYEDIGAPETLDHRMMTGQYPSAQSAYRNGSRWG